MTISQLYVPCSSVVALIDKTEKLVLKDFFHIHRLDTICRTFVELNLGSTHGTCRLNQMSHQCRSKVELIHLGPVRHMKSTGVWTRPKPSTTSIYLHACPNEPKGTFISFKFGESWLLINYEIWGHITESGMRLKKTFFALLYLKTYKAGPKRPNVSHL